MAPMPFRFNDAAGVHKHVAFGLESDALLAQAPSRLVLRSTRKDRPQICVLGGSLCRMTQRRVRPLGSVHPIPIGAFFWRGCAILHTLNKVAALYRLASSQEGARMRRLVAVFAIPVLSRDMFPARTVVSASPRRERGFTLIELLVVLAILGLLIAFVAPAMIRQLGSAKHKISDQSIQRLAGILDLYRLDVGAYPTTEQGLSALNTQPAGVSGWNGPYIKDQKGIQDPWGRLFAYRAPSQRPGEPFDIVSLGADGRTGGTGEDADIINR
jgi:general secretion pathway protein G